MKLITVSAYTRHKYLGEALKHLSQCFGINNYKVHVCVDKAQTPQPAIIQTLRYYQNRLNLTYELNKERLDCSGNIFKCLDYGFQQTDFLIHIEDDIILAKDALVYFEYCQEKYRNDDDVFSISCYNRYGSRNYKPTSTELLYRHKHFDPWGWGTWSYNWPKMKENWQFGYEARYKDGKMVLPPGNPWGVNTDKTIRGNRSRVFPECARSKNIGVYEGRHTMSPEKHLLDHDVKWWANDFDLNEDITFIESNTSCEYYNDE